MIETNKTKNLFLTISLNFQTEKILYFFTNQFREEIVH